MSTYEKLIKKAKNFPSATGVYFFIGKNREILYIGRAVNLKRRILNYFQKDLDLRIAEMVETAADIKYKKTKNLLEAVILEANLIKKYWPKYNVKEKDDRSFIYIIIPKNVDFPMLKIIRGKELEKFLSKNLENKNYYIFGPYQSFALVKNALKIIRRIFPYSDCKFSGKACFNYQIGLCPGVCVGAIGKQDYQKNIKNIILLLKGERKKLLGKLKKENPEKIKALEHIQDVALIENDLRFGVYESGKNLIKRIEGYDISHFSGKETVGAMAVLIGNELDKSQYRKFIIKNVGNNDLLALEEMILRRLNHKEWQYPDLILIDGGLPQIRHIAKVFKNKNINIPIVGISKFGGDKLIFPKEMEKTTKDLLLASKNNLLKLRDEAHRFAILFGRKKRIIK